MKHIAAVVCHTSVNAATSRHTPEMLLWLLLLGLVLHSAHGTIVLVTKDNATFEFQDADAAFGGMIPPSGMHGTVRRAIPFDGCDAFDNPVDPEDQAQGQFALIIRGGCHFDVKVLNAQLAGFDAAIIYDDVYEGELITMSGRRFYDIQVPAVFISRESGERMLQIAESAEALCFLVPSFDATAWSIMMASFLALLALCSVFTLFVYIRRTRFREIAARMLEREPEGMTESEVKALPELVYAAGAAESASLDTCAICLDDFEEAANLRVLRCKHGFHVECVDKWLLTRSCCCPVCKRDCREKEGDSAASQDECREQSNELEQNSRRAAWLRFLQPQRSLFAAFFGQHGALETPLLPVSPAEDEASSSESETENTGEVLEVPDPENSEASSGSGRPAAHAVEISPV